MKMKRKGRVKIEHYDTPYDKEPVDRNKKGWVPLPKETVKDEQDGIILEYKR
jgi:hypothetical protein